MAQSLNQIFSVNVRAQRTARGISQEKLAELSGLHRTYLGQVERAETNVTLEVVDSIASALDLEPTSLLLEVVGRG